MPSKTMRHKLKLLSSFILVCIIFGINYINAKNILFLLVHFLNPVKIITIKPTDTFLTILELDFYISMYLLIMISYFWVHDYIKDALEYKELKVISNLKYSWVLGSCGVFFSIFSTKRYILPYLFQYSEAIGIENTISLIEVVSLFVYNCFLFFFIFQVPIIVYQLVKYNIIRKELITNNRKIIYFAFLIMACVFSPPDLISTFIILTPFLVLFEISLFFASR